MPESKFGGRYLVDEQSWTVTRGCSCSALLPLSNAIEVDHVKGSCVTAAKLKVCLEKSLIKVNLRHFHVALSWRRIAFPSPYS